MRVLIGFLLLCSAQLSSATIIEMVTIEPDDFAIGTNLTNATPGAHVYTLAGSDVFAAGPQVSDPFAMAPTGDLVFARGIGSGLSNWYLNPSTTNNFLGNIWERNQIQDPSRGLVVRFDGATDYVSFQGGGQSVGPALLAYDGNGDFISSGLVSRVFDQYRGPTNDGGGAEFFFSYEITSTDRNIAFVLIGGDDNQARIDRLTFSKIPEPGTLLLFACGLLGLMGMQRKRQGV